MLESEEAIKERGGAPQIYGEVCGYGQTNDAHHILKPFDNGLGILAAVMGAMEEEHIHPSQLDAVNCHARSTVSGDGSESYGLHALFSCGESVKKIEDFQMLSPEDVIEYYDKPLPNKQPLLHGQKGNLGHSVAAAGAIESVFSLLSIQKQFVPKIKGLTTPEDPTLNYAFENQEHKINYMAKNGFVFGGINCTLLFKKHDA